MGGGLRISIAALSAASVKDRRDIGQLAHDSDMGDIAKQVRAVDCQVFGSIGIGSSWSLLVVATWRRRRRG
jgi:hypothetical protein